MGCIEFIKLENCLLIDTNIEDISFLFKEWAMMVSEKEGGRIMCSCSVYKYIHGSNLL